MILADDSSPAQSTGTSVSSAMLTAKIHKKEMAGMKTCSPSHTVATVMKQKRQQVQEATDTHPHSAL